MPSRRRWVLTGAFAILTLLVLNSLRDWKQEPAPLQAFRAQLARDPISTPWSRRAQQHPVSEYIRLPSKRPARLPRVQPRKWPPEPPEARKTRLERQAAVRASFRHAWTGYRKHAWGRDEVFPLTGKANDAFGGWAATLVDSLDTLWIMGFRDEFAEAADFAAGLDFGASKLEELNVFETSIRYLGGLLAAHDLSGDQRLLRKALELGEMIYAAFDTPNRMPITRWKWEKALAGEPQKADNWVIAAELGSFTLEFTRLTQLTGDARFFDAAQRITDLLHAQQFTTKVPGLWPTVFNAAAARLDEAHGFGLGAFADSLYEYLPKAHALLGGRRPEYKAMHTAAMDAARKHLFFRPMTPDAADVLVAGSLNIHADGQAVLDPTGQHLVCFAAGMLALGARLCDRPADLPVAHKLAAGCVWAYGAQPSGLMPEVFRALACPADGPTCAWNQTHWEEAALERARADDAPADATAAAVVRERRLAPGLVDIPDRRYILRPEAAESLFVLHRVTGDASLQDQGWAMFQAAERAARTKIAHAALEDVTVETPPQADRMESFWTAETLKYYYLLFAEPDLVSLDEYVFNTEAHPLRRPQ